MMTWEDYLSILPKFSYQQHDKIKQYIFVHKWDMMLHPKLLTRNNYSCSESRDYYLNYDCRQKLVCKAGCEAPSRRHPSSIDSFY